MNHYSTLEVTLDQHVATIYLNRPQKANAINAQLLAELKQVFAWMDQDSAVRVGILAAKGASFCAGLDFDFFGEQLNQPEHCAGRRRENLRAFILEIQQVFSSIEHCRKPVLAQVQGACIGGGLDMIAACDMRYSSNQAFFSIKEIDLGFTADAGSLQRLPQWMPRGMVHELAYTGRRIAAQEAQAFGLVNRCYEDEAELRAAVKKIAADIAAKSPLAIRGTKEMLRYARDHRLDDALNYNATWNAALMLSADLEEAFQAALQKRPAEFKE